MANLTTYGRNVAANALDGALYAALHNGDPGVSGSANELSGSGYARAAVTLTTTGNVISHASDIDWSAVSGDFLGVSHISIWDASSAGNCLHRGALPAAFDWLTGNPARCQAGNLTITFT